MPAAVHDQALPNRQKFTGGGSFRGDFLLNATWPLVRLTLDEAGVQADIRPRFIKHMAWRSPATDLSEPVWVASWADLRQVDMAKRTAVFRGREEFRFGMVNRRKFAEMIATLRSHGVPIVEHRSTLGWYFKWGW